MGQSKGGGKFGGYNQVPTVTDQQKTLLQQLLSQAGPQFGEAAEGYRQFLPGGGGGKAIADAANQRFQQQTIPSIMNAFGSGAKTSSALNQALAAGAANLNTDIAAQLAQMQLQASQGMGGLASQQAQLGSTPFFAYLQQQPSALQSALKGGVTGAGALAPLGPWGAAAGGAAGFLGGLF